VRLYPLIFAASFIGACSNAPIAPPSNSHISAESVARADTASIPKPVQSDISLAKPKPAAKAETYSVVVSNVKAQDLLFALARDAKLNVDVHPGINGTVSLNAIDQTLQQLLTRIAKQVDMRWELDGPNLIVMPDTPFLRNYKIDYVNLSRDVSSSVSINTQIASTSAGASTGGGGGGGGGNNSSTTVTTKAKNNFWESLEKNLKDILLETDKILPEGSSDTIIEKSDQQSTTGTGAAGGRGGAAQNNLAGSPNPASIATEGTTVVKRTTFREAASIMMNAEAGVVVVRATSRQHEKVQEYLDLVMSTSKRQVMIEATIAEVTLSDGYQQGINWQSLRTLRKGTSTSGVSEIQNPSGPTLATPGSSFLLNYVAPGLGISATLSLLETFGNVKVISSPRISVLNNQTALLKVVNNIVYFTIKADTTNNTTGPSQTTVTTTPQSVAVGLVMSVTPQISESDMILLNVRPTISSVIDFINDPNPSIPSGLSNKVPEIQTREMESILRLTNGEIAVMGGLMKDQLNQTTDAVPGLSRLPGVGNLFTQRNDNRTKTELVIFLRPTVIRDSSIDGDFRSLRGQLPSKDFFNNNPGPQQQQVGVGGSAQ
jgi:MSHA biogenesis protein MshL